MERMNLQSRWVVLTGASSGLGREMARVLARDYRANLVLVARRQERLKELAQELADAYGTESQVLPADLGQVSEAERVFREATADHSIQGVILNAGVTHFGHYDELSFEDFQQMLAVNVTSTVRLATSFLPYLEKERTQGGLLIVASMAGLTPLAYQTAYSATKGFLINFGCALWHELRPRGVSVTTFAPGGIDTEMTATKRFDGLRSWLVPADRCAREGVEAFVNREYLRIPGLLYRVGSVVTRILPQRLVVGRVAAQYRRSLEPHG